MEHLIYSPDARTFRSDIRNLDKLLSGKEDIEWFEMVNRSVDAVEPCIKWLEHDHEGSSYFSSQAGESNDRMESMDLFVESYALGWNDPSTSKDLRKAHGSLVSLSEDEASHRIAAFVQAWLFFGLLEGICKIAIPSSLLLRNDGAGTNFLYTARLPALLEWWKRRLPPDTALNFLAGAQKCSLYASDVLADLLKKSKVSCEPLARKLHETLITIEPGLSALHEIISDFVEHHSQKSIRSFSASESPFPRGYSERLIRKGWCPFVIATAETNMSPSFLRYVDAAGYELNDEGHSLCTGNICRRNQVDLAVYAVQHRPPQCRCKLVKPDLGLVFDILEDDYIPLVQYQPGTKTLKVGALDPSDPSADYIAFSHVWADGLGSCTERGLPTCQLERLHSLTTCLLKADPWFWVDGLCVPKREPYRNMAIQMMKYTYGVSLQSIVLDNSIRRISVDDDPILIAWTLYASGWMGRLWTYQEGFIPPRVDLELSDGLCQIYELVQRLYRMNLNKDEGNPIPAILAKDLVASLQKIRPLDRQFRQRDRVRQIVDVFNALTRRLTSRPEDQLLVLGLLLDIDLNKILVAEGELQWRNFYLALGRVPWTIVFDRRPKLSSLVGFRWAPATWISSGRDAYLRYDEALATCTEEGLRISLTILLLDHACKTLEGYLLVEVENEFYEIRSPSSLSSTTRPQIEGFDIIFIRCLKQEEPQAMLADHSPAWMPVGVVCWDAVSSEEFKDLSWYDFQDGWDIRWVDERDDLITQDGTLQSGKWIEKDIRFT